MIASIRGRVLGAGAGWVVIDVGGVGLRVEIPSGRMSPFHVGDEASLHTWLVVREDSLTLFGFSTQEEIDVFGHLIGVSGVGPRSALGVLAELTPLEIARAVQDEDEKPFRRVPGIGPKTAKLLLVSLAGKLPEIGLVDTPDGSSGSVSSTDAVSDAVREGLVGLGWKEAAAAGAVEDALAAGAPRESAALLRAALALLQAGRGGGSR